MRRDLGEEAYKIRHTIVSDNQYALETLHSKDWLYFINRLLEVSAGDITLLNLSGINQNENDGEELKTTNDTIENLEICQNFMLTFMQMLAVVFKITLKNAPDALIEKMEDDLRLNLYSIIDLKNEPNTKEIIHTFDRFFFAFGRFPFNLFDRLRLFRPLSDIKILVGVILED